MSALEQKLLFCFPKKKPDVQTEEQLLPLLLPDMFYVVWNKEMKCSDNM